MLKREIALTIPLIKGNGQTESIGLAGVKKESEKVKKSTTSLRQSLGVLASLYLGAPTLKPDH